MTHASSVAATASLAPAATVAYVFPPPAPVSVPVVGQAARFAAHRIYCVGRNYEEHAKEMGHSGREAPFFFMQPADAEQVPAIGQERQRSTVDQLIWNVAETIAQLSAAWTLQPGDLVFTGTPAGVGPVERGDKLTGSIAGLVPLCVRVE